MEKKIFNLLTTLAEAQSTFEEHAAARTELLQKIGKKSVQYERIFVLFSFSQFLYIFYFNDLVVVPPYQQLHKRTA